MKLSTTKKKTVYDICHLASSNLGLVEPLRKPLEVAIAEKRIAVDLDGVELRQVRKSILLDGRDHVVVLESVANPFFFVSDAPASVCS